MKGELASLPPVLQRALAALPAIESLTSEAARHAVTRLSERIRRDLLPRVSSAGPILLAAIAGPNNVGKSSLFNSLVGAQLSPARAEGGLTKQCLAAAHPRLMTPELRGFLELRYELIPVANGRLAPVDQSGPAGRLYLAISDQVPPGLLVMDTPDFDSIYLTNRENAEALLVTVDILVFVVSRQTYQNAALVQFLREAIGHGRPYLLVYNEATRSDVARAHLDKLTADVRLAPLACYAAPHQPAVEAGTALLATEPLGKEPPLATLLSDPAYAAPLKARALSASLADAAEELRVIAEALKNDSADPERLRSRLRHELQEIGSGAALKSVPADILIEAFRDELDARSRFHRWVRLPFRGLAAALTFVGRTIQRSMTGPAAHNASLLQIQKESIKDGMRRLVDALAPEVAAWRGDADTARMITESLGPVTLGTLERPLDLPELRDAPEDRARLYTFCRELIAKELEAGKDQEAAIQALTTLVYSVPASAAAFVTVATGGMGHDAVIWAGTLLSTPLLERFVDLLGIQIRGRVTRSWAEAHGATLARALEAKFFSLLLQRLDAQVEQSRHAVGELDAAREALT